MALSLAQAGADVVVNYSRRAAEAEVVAEEIRQLGRHTYAHQADVSNEEQVKAMFQRMFREFGTVDILVNNAGLQKDAPFDQMTLADWQLVCLAGTFSPSCRQIRSTRLWFTLHPSHCSIAVTLRYPYRPYQLANRTTAILSASSPSATVAQYRYVDRVAQAPGKRASQRYHAVPAPTPRISAGGPGSEVSPCCLL